MTAVDGFGARVLMLMAERQLQTGRKVTARGVAADLGIPEGSFSRYLQRKHPPPDRVTTPMAAYFGVTKGWLRYGEGERLASPAPGTPALGTLEDLLDQSRAHELTPAEYEAVKAEKHQQSPAAKRRKARGRK